MVAQEVFNTLDRDRNGSIDFREFNKLVCEFTHGMPSELKPTHREIYLAFAKLDDDNSGRLEFEEVRPFIELSKLNYPFGTGIFLNGQIIRIYRVISV